MAYKKSLFITVGLFFSIASFAEFKDPTKPICYAQNGNSISCQTVELKLSSILISGDYKRAVINGRTVKEGDEIFSSIKILNISKNSVLIKQRGDQQKRNLILYNISTQNN